MSKQVKQQYIANEFGDLDVNYYISKAYSLRNEAIKAESLKLSNGIKQAISSLAGFVSSPKAA